MRIGIIGAGLAGLTCATQLARAGMTPMLFDKGSRPGGRMSTWIDGDNAWDYGAQYFTVRDPGFAEEVAIWSAEGAVAPWPACEPDAWVGTPGMSAPLAALASRLDVYWGRTVSRISREHGLWWITHGDGRTGSSSSGPFDAVVVAIPAEQAVSLLALHDLEMAREAMLARSQPCWTAMFAFAEILPLPDVLRDHGGLAWAARNSSKPGRHGQECWVVQADGDWSLRHLELEREAALPALLQLLVQAAGSALPEPSFARAHRWRFAMTAARGQTPLWNSALGLGACGDWRVGPRVECAWQSGAALARAIAAMQAGLAPAITI